MKRRNLLTFFVGILTCCLCVVAINNGTAHAAVDNQRIMRKWLLTQYFNCAKDNINTPLTAKANGLVSDDVFSAVGDMKLPSYNFMHSVQSGAVDCKTVFVGSNEFKGLLDVYDSADKSVDWASPSESQSFLEKVGYSAEGTSGGEQEFAIKATYTGRMYQYQFYCGWFGISCESPLEGQEETVKIKAIRDGGKLKYSFANSKSGFWDALKVEIDDQYLTIKTDPSFWSACSDQSGQEKKFRLRDDLTELFKEINDAFANNTWDLTCAQLDFSGGGNDWYYDYHYHFIAGDIVDSGAGGDYAYPDGSERYDATKDGIKRLTGASMNDMELSNSERYTLYYYYLDKALPENVLNRMTCSPDSTLNLTAVKLKSPDGTFKECYVNFNGTDPSSISVFTQKSTDHRSRQPYSYIDSITIQDVIDWFNSVDTSTLGDVDIVVGESVNASQPGEGSSSCMAGAARSLGWIICPVMEWMAGVTEELYNDVVEPSLKMEPQLFDEKSGDNNDTFDAWKTFQGFANIIFIIIFLAVIFSQLTGVGIDNYGIKKILPKLIVTAVLMNLSYYICVIAVDLSNILGNGLQSIFEGLGNGLTLEPLTVDGQSGAIGATVLTAVGIAGAMWALVAAIVANPAMLLSLLVALIGAVISIAFLFVILAARKAAIVVLTVLSPLAFVCYALPNTKKYFDKWVKIWTALLLLYPICGLLVGGGGYVSKLLLTSGFAGGGFFNAFTALVISIVPIFFIPKLVKSSMAAMGNIGATISGLGQRLSNRAQSGARNSEAYKNAQRMGLERRTRLRAGLDRNGNLTAAGERRARRAGTGFGRLLGMDKRQAAYVAQARRNIGESEAAGALLTGALARTGIAGAEALPDSGSGEELGKSFGASTEGAYYGRQFLEAADAGSITDMNAALEAMKSSGMKPKDIAKLLRYANNHGRFDSMDNNTRAAWFRDLSKKYGGDFLATDLELGNYLRAGGTGSDGTGTALGNYGDYATAGGLNIDDIKPEDIIKLSGDSLAGLAASGKLDQSMAQRVLALNPNISADKRIMLGAIASGHATGRTYDSRNNVLSNGSINGDVAQFKQDATNLMNDHGAGSPVAPATMNVRGAINRATVEAWASATPQSVNVVQNFNGGGSQLESVDVDLRGIGGQKLGGAGGSTS